MVVDTSTILAVLLNEPEGGLFLTRLSDTPQPLLSAANWLELAIVIDGSRTRNGWLILMRSWKDLTSPWCE
jgi:ribonuclease VapC